MGKTQRIGMLGEELVAKFLMKRGFNVIDRNFRKKWGEIDVIATKKNILHFVEVKSVSRNLYGFLKSIPSTRPQNKVTHETYRGQNTLESTTDTKQVILRKEPRDSFRPEDNIHSMKIARLKRAIQSYLLSGRVSSETKWQFDVAAVFIDKDRKKAKIDFIEDLIL